MLRAVIAYEPLPGNLEQIAQEMELLRPFEGEAASYLIFNGEAISVTHRSSAKEIEAEYRIRVGTHK